LVVNLVSKFWGHDKAYESNHVLEKMKGRRMTTTPTSTINKTTKVKRSREGGFCVIFFGFCFVVGFFFLYVSVKPKKFFITKNLVITYKLSTINGFCHKVKDFSMVLGFFSFCLNPREITKEIEKIDIKVCIASVNV
jgi:hypothetical protein